MPAIARTTHFLAVRTNPQENAHLIRIFRRFEEALNTWGSTSRLSPIFPLEGSCIPDLKRACQLFLVGPVYPGSIEVPPEAKVFLTHGLFNALFFTHENETIASLQERYADVRWELWDIEKDTVVATKCCPAVYEAHNASETVIQPLANVPPESTPTAREYSLALARAHTLAELYHPEQAQELRAFDAVFRPTVETIANTDALAAHAQLVKANAALLGLNSQTYSCPSPVLNNPCRTQIHGLLGIGTAQIALSRTVRFVSDALASSGLMYSLENSDKLPCVELPREIDTVGPEDSTVCTSVRESLRNIASRADPDETRLPIILYFSKDGFRCDNIAITAPPETITGCNTHHWAAGTLTHEIAHTIIDGVIAQCLPDLSSDIEIRRVLEHIKHKNCANLQEQLKMFLFSAICRLRADLNGQTEFSADLVRHNLQEANEIMAHVFDFLYTHRADEEKYLLSVWSSWAVVPNIAHHVRVYLLRSMCAILANNLRKQPSPYRFVIGRLKEILADDRLSAIGNTSLDYIEEARTLLDKDEDNLILDLIKAAALVTFVANILYSPDIARSIQQEAVATGSKSPYRIRKLHFDPVGITNPLRLIEQFTTDGTPDTVDSLWLLQMLAFRS